MGTSARFCRYTDAMDEQQIPHNLHLFVDTSNAPNSEIFKSISSVCDDVHADVLVLAAYKKVRILWAQHRRHACALEAALDLN